MSYELTSLTRSLADANGARCKGWKADLLHILQDMAEDFSVPQGVTHAIAAMCLLHGISRPAPIYGALALQVLHLMLIGTDHADCKSIARWVVDTYPPSSIKATAHSMIEEHMGNTLEYTMKYGSQHLPSQFKRALCYGPYKEELKFFLKNWKNQNWVYTGQWTLYITSGSECHSITSPAPRSVQSVVQLDPECTHEETDTRILLHVKHALCPSLTLVSLPDCVCCLCCSPTE